MKKMTLLGLSFLLASSLQAQRSVKLTGYVKGNALTDAQADDLSDSMWKWIVKNIPESNPGGDETVDMIDAQLKKQPALKRNYIEKLNAQLKKLNLGTDFQPIDVTSKEFSMKPVGLTGFTSTAFRGFEVFDGKNTYCLPCMIGNFAQYGVVKGKADRSPTLGGWVDPGFVPTNKHSTTD